jgi:hypothetical protein
MLMLPVTALIASLLLSPSTSGQNCVNLPTPPTKNLPAGFNFPAVSPTMPFDMTKPAMPNIEDDQKAFDLFSWAQFISLNWPSKADGTPLPGTLDANPTEPRVWERFIAARQVFKKDGVAPDPWGGIDSTLASRVKGMKALEGQRVLLAATKAGLSGSTRRDSACSSSHPSPMSMATMSSTRCG